VQYFLSTSETFCQVSTIRYYSPFWISFFLFFGFVLRKCKSYACSGSALNSSERIWSRINILLDDYPTYRTEVHNLHSVLHPVFGLLSWDKLYPLFCLYSGMFSVVPVSVIVKCLLFLLMHLMSKHDSEGGKYYPNADGKLRCRGLCSYHKAWSSNIWLQRLWTEPAALASRWSESPIPLLNNNHNNYAVINTMVKLDWVWEGVCWTDLWETKGFLCKDIFDV